MPSTLSFIYLLLLCSENQYQLLVLKFNLNNFYRVKLPPIVLLAVCVFAKRRSVLCNINKSNI